MRPAPCEIEGAKTHRIEPRIMQVLCALALAEGRVVSRDELIERCWEGRIVGEDAVTRCIARLRQISQVEPGCFEIRTVTRVGYQLIAEAAPQRMDSTLSSLTEAQTPSAERTAPSSGFRLDRRRAAFALGAVLVVAAAAAWLLPLASPRWQIDQIRPFVTTEQAASSPALSPSGDLLAYSAAGSDGVSHIYLRNLTGGERIQLTNGPGETLPKWLPSGGRLAFRASAIGEPCRIMEIAVPADRPRELLTCRNNGASPYTFAPDGTALYYSDSDSALAFDHLMRLDMASGTRTTLTDHLERGVADVIGEVSPNGRYLAFQRAFGPTSSALMALDLKTGSTKTVWQVETDKWDAIAWLDDQTLLTAWRRADDRALVVVPLRGERTRLTSATQAFYSLSRDKNGVFATQTNFAVQSLVSLGPDGLPVTHLTSEGLIADPAYAMDGSLAFLADNAGEQGLWIERPGGKPIRIAGFGIRQAYHPAWSPDGKLISVTQVIDRVPRLRLIDTDGTTRRDVPLPGFDVGRSFWSADGRQISVLALDTPGNNLLRYDMATQQITRTSLDDWSQVQMDGDAVYAIHDGTGSKAPIWRIFPDHHLITDHLEMIRLDDWAIFHGDLYFVERVNDLRDRLVRQTADGRIVQTWQAGVTPWLGGIAVDPLNGSPTLVQVNGGRDDIYLMRTSH